MLKTIAAELIENDKDFVQLSATRILIVHSDGVWLCAVIGSVHLDDCPRIAKVI